MFHSHHTHDIAVVGARCAGAATALLLARLGYDVALVDRAHFPSDTLSTHAIARGGVVQLQRWGLLDAVLTAGVPAIRQVSFHTDSMDMSRRVKHTAGVDHLMAPRRYVLDTLLVEAATAAGARLYEGTTVTSLLRDPIGHVTGVRTRASDGSETELSARLVVGADGVRSRMARDVGAVALMESTSPSGTFYAYFAGLDADGFEFHVSDRALAGVFPCAADEACVWISSPTEDSAAVRSAGAGKVAALVAQIEAGAPELGRRLRRCHSTSGVRGALGLPNVIRQPYGPGWALVGDAGYHRDPITGHGITDAFRDAELLARAIDRWLSEQEAESGALAGYQEERDRAIGTIFGITRALTEFPGVERFVGLQKQLSDAIEIEAETLAGQPALRAALNAVAA
jgi:2-polyprenyl-6-methoxyphenol hydroxylase-like FAD-dependent oxidoreductase